MLETVGKELVKESAKKIPDIIRAYFPSWTRKSLKRRFDNACAGIEDISEGLAQRGLKVDLQRYFEQELKIPLALINALGEEEKPPLRDLLKKIFSKHLSGDFNDDSFYPAFIEIIKALTPLEVAILKSSYDFLCDNKIWGTVHCASMVLEFDEEKIMSDFKCDKQTFNAALVDLERHKIFATIFPAESMLVGGGVGVKLTAPGLTDFGILFLQACIE